MQAKEYFGSGEDLGLDHRDSVQTDQFELAPQNLSTTSGHDKSETTGNMALNHSHPNLRPAPRLQLSSDDAYSQDGAAVVEPLEDPHPAQASRADFYKYLFTDGNWTDLLATSANWMLLDFTFFMLGVNSSSFVPTMFGETPGPSTAPYKLLIWNQKHTMESTSIGALLGSALSIFVMHCCSRRKLQTWGFLILGPLFVVVGALYITLPTTNAHVAIVVFYGICQLFYYLGTLDWPNLQSLRNLILYKVQIRPPLL